MPEVTERTVRIPVKGAGSHSGHQVRTINISTQEGIKALYCVTDKVVFTYLFARNKGWTLSTAQEWVTDHTKKLSKVEEVSVDQEQDFIRLKMIFEDGNASLYEPNSEIYVYEVDDLSYNDVVKENEHIVSAKALEMFEENTFCRREIEKGVFSVFGILKVEGFQSLMEYRFDVEEYDIEKVKQWVAEHEIQGLEIKEASVMDKIEKIDQNNAEEYEVNDEQMQVIKVEKSKRLVYGVFLVPEKADHDGDVISADDIEKVAHEFMVEYREIDEMHKDVIDADIVESAIAWVDKLDYHGKQLSKGTWFGAVKVHNDEVWEKIQKGEYAGFSVRISGVREPIKE